MASAQPRILRQCGALPFSFTGDGGIRVLLVTTRGRGNWIIPKGWPIRDLSDADTAAREAYEEAGVVGSVVGEAPVGSYRYQKRRTPRRLETFEVSVFLLEVERQLRKWPEKSERETRWFVPEEASTLVTPAGLAQIVRSATSRMLTDQGDATRMTPASASAAIRAAS